MKIKGILFICCFLPAFTGLKAQNTLAKLKYESAEQDYLNAKYFPCIERLEELEKQGFKNPKTLHLKIMARSCFVLGMPRIDYVFSGFKMVQTLTKECDYYLQNYDVEGLEDKYKEVYAVRSALYNLPQNETDWNVKVKELRAKEKAKKDKIIEDFVNSFVLVEKGSFYKNAKSHVLVYRPNGYRDTIRYRPVKTTIDHSFYISKERITNELYWALFQEPVFSYATMTPAVRNKSDKDAMYHHKQLGWLTKNMELAYPAYYRANYDNLKLFITKLNQVTGKKFRLPSDDEWEYALRGGHKQQLLVTKYIIGGNKRKGYKYRYIYTYKNRTQFAKPNELGLVFYKLSDPTDQGVYISEMAADRIYTGVPPGTQALILRASSHGSSYGQESLSSSYPSGKGGYNPEKEDKHFRLVLVAE